MIHLQAYKFRLKTNCNQERQLRQFAGSCRFVWNKALALQKQRLDNKEKRLSYNKIALFLPEWKKEHPFLKETHSQIIQQTLMNLDRAIKDAFNKTSPKKFPVFKKKGKHDFFRYPQGFRIDQNNSRIYLPKIGWIRYHNSRTIEGIPKNITVSISCGHWYISVQTEREVKMPAHPSNSIIGIDAGIAKLATLSDGTVFEPVNSFKDTGNSLPGIRGTWQGRRSSATIGKRQRQRYKVFKQRSVIPGATTFTKPLRRYAKTTLSS